MKETYIVDTFTEQAEIFCVVMDGLSWGINTRLKNYKMIRNKLESLKASKFASFKVTGLVSDIGPVGGGAPPVFKTQTKDGKLYDVDKWHVGHSHCHKDNFTNGPNGDVFYWDGNFWRQLKGKGNC